MAWLYLIVGSATIVVAGLQFRRLRGTSVAWPPAPWTAVALGGSFLLTGVAKLTGPSTLSTVANGGSILCLGAASVLVYRLYQRKPRSTPE